MGGNYKSYGAGAQARKSALAWRKRMNRSLRGFENNHEVADLVKAFNAFSEANKSGFIKVLLERARKEEAPKEFPEIEYEVKFDIKPVAPERKRDEPTIEDYLDAFQFPPTQEARFLKDAVNHVAEGNNHFYGSNGSEMLVVIEKAGGTYLKEKNQPMPMSTRVPLEEAIVKRTEARYPATMEQILKKTAEVVRAGGEYKGYVRKEKGDAFVLDTHDGRIYSFTVTRAHKNGNGRVQRQLEMEYAGFVPGFPSFVKNDESQLAAGMLDLARHVAVISDNAVVRRGWRMRLALTHERKYDFVSGSKPKRVMIKPRALLYAP